MAVLEVKAAAATSHWVVWGAMAAAEQAVVAARVVLKVEAATVHRVQRNTQRPG